MKFVTISLPEYAEWRRNPDGRAAMKRALFDSHGECQMRSPGGVFLAVVSEDDVPDAAVTATQQRTA